MKTFKKVFIYTFMLKHSRSYLLSSYVSTSMKISTEWYELLLFDCVSSMCLEIFQNYFDKYFRKKSIYIDMLFDKVILNILAEF